MSWTGTVRCSHCYVSGHNKTSCPELKKKWEEDPNSYYGRQWQKILDRKAKPKICSYCGESGHTRAGCVVAKKHKAQFQLDLVLWRKALAKWMNEIGLGTGAMVRGLDVGYRRNGEYQYPTEENYIPPVGMYMGTVMNHNMTHYYGIMNTGGWISPDPFIGFEYLGATSDTPYYRKSVTLNLPCIPGIVPRYGQGWYYQDEHMDRTERVDATQWEVVSPAPAPLNTDHFLNVKEIRKVVKEHFKASKDCQTRDGFRTFTDFQRNQLQRYVNGEIELSEMVDPEVPAKDT